MGKVFTAPYVCVSCGKPKTRTEDDLCPQCRAETEKDPTAVRMSEHILRKAIATYGKSTQVDMAIEEMSELTKALCKERRYELVPGKHAVAHANVIEEIADVMIMCRQLLIIFDKDNEINYKINRLNERLNETEK